MTVIWTPPPPQPKKPRRHFCAVEDSGTNGYGSDKCSWGARGGFASGTIWRCDECGAYWHKLSGYTFVWNRVRWYHFDMRKKIRKS